MPPAVIARVNVLGKAEPSILTFTDRHGREIGDYPQEGPVADDEASAANYDYVSEITGVGRVPILEPTGVEVVDLQVTQDVPLGTNADIDFGLVQEPLDTLPHEHEPTRYPNGEPTAVALPQNPAPPRQGMPAHNDRVRKPPKKYVTSMQGKKYAVALSWIAECLKVSNNGIALAQMSVKLMSPGVHRKADIVGMIMAQLSMKAAIKKWGERASYAILKEMKQLYWHNSYMPRHWHNLSMKEATDT
jgi:hypothetical protein